MKHIIQLLVEAVDESKGLEDIGKNFMRRIDLINEVLETAIEVVGTCKKLKDIPEALKYQMEREFTLNGFVTTDPWWDKAYIDTPRIRTEVHRKGRTTEIIEWTEPYVREDSTPDQIGLVEMGREDRKTPWLDSDYEEIIITDKHGKRSVKRPVNTMNDRMFREMCVVYGNNLYAMYKKTEVDLNTGTQPDWVQEQLGCEMADALTLVECWKRLGIDFMTARKLVKGYWDERNMEWKNGLQNIGKMQGKKYASYFESLIWEVDAQLDDTRAHYHDVTQRMIASGEWRLKYHEDMPSVWSQMRFIEDMSIVEMDTEIVVIEDDSDDEPGFVSHLGDEEYVIRGEDGFGVFPLYNGSEDIDYELGCEISMADINGISDIQRRFFRQYNQYTGRWRGPEYWWMTDSQKSKCWIRIKARKTELLKDVMKSLTKDSHEVLNIASGLTGNQRRALVAAYCAGNSFNISGYVYKWDNTPSAEEKYAVWAKFREMS